MKLKCVIGALAVLYVFSALAAAQNSDYRISAPYSHKNLTIFLIHGKNETSKTNILTLQEAMQRRILRVYETSDVNELSVENISKEFDVFIQSGDIVKGGKQDRVLAVSIIIRARSGRIKIEAFCVESGRWQKGLGMPLPWPWTINVEGKGHYFSSKAEAIAHTAALMRAGKTSIDVGCMQVNLRHHGKAFASLDEAFDPAHNVRYGARFLRENYTDLGDWVRATAAYHSRTPVYGAQYLTRIEKSWNRIVGKVAAARSNGGLPVAQASSPLERGKMDSYRSQVATADVSPRAPTAPARKMNSIASTRNVKVIKVTESSRRASDVLVIHPQQEAVIRLADARPVPPAASPVAQDTIPHRVAIDSQGNATDMTGGTGGTNFVFAN